MIQKDEFVGVRRLARDSTNPREPCQLLFLRHHCLDGLFLHFPTYPLHVVYNRQQKGVINEEGRRG
jgi:hypothetical protein